VGITCITNFLKACWSCLYPDFIYSQHYL